MNQGMLWFDDQPKCDLAQKIARAAQHYRQKFGVAPQICYIHPSALKDKGNGRVIIAGVKVAALPTVLRDHFWLGQDTA